jgi:hypothetical protein
MKHALISLATSLTLAAAGCSTGPLPRHAQLVGGGLSINWAAPSNGTAILYEKTTGKVIATASLKTDETFEFELGQGNTDDMIQKMLGEKIPGSQVG